MQEGSWGAEGNNQVWLNPDTSWTWTHIYPAELYLRDLCTSARWKDPSPIQPLAERIVKQLCRELLLLESSDWQFLITTGAARDYAEHRFNTHLSQFNDLRSLLESLEAHHSLTDDQQNLLVAIEDRDNISHQTRTAAATASANLPHLATTAVTTELSDSSTSEIQKFLPNAAP